MTEGQWRVLVLLLVLLGMEMLRNPNVASFFQTLAFNPFKQAAS
jgi:hypothetical protein